MGRTFSLSRAIACAAAAHVLAAIVVRAVPVTHAPRTMEPQAFLEITTAPARETPSAPIAAPEPAEPRPRVGTVSNAPATTTSEAVSSAIASAVAEPAAAGDAGWFDPVRVATTSPALPGRRLELPPQPATDSTPRNDHAITAVRDALAAHDQSIGLGGAGPLQAAAHDAASATVAPDTGVGELEIDCDGDGRVVVVRTSQSNWQPVATRLARVMAGKTMRVRPGSHGLRVKLRIVAERTLPSGNAKTAGAAGAVPDDAPGAEKVCDGEGITRRCVAGMPVGATVSGQDSSNLGARPSRVVRVNVDSETDL